LLLAGYGAFAAILFVAFVTASFPYADTISALVAPMSMKLVFQRQKMNFPIGARLENVRLISVSSEQLLLESPDVTVSPGVVSFFLGRPCLRIRAQIYGGMIDTTVHQSGRTTIADFEFESLNLADMSRTAGELAARAQAERYEEGGPPVQPSVALNGEVSGSGSAQVTGPDIVAGSARMVLLGRHIEAAVVNGLPPLDLGIVRGRVRVEQGVAILQDVKAFGSDGDLEANGAIRLASNIADSEVRITVSLTPTAKGRASFGLLFNMLPHAPGEGPYHVEGALRSPSVS
jgi:type II secretion system protein N